MGRWRGAPVVLFVSDEQWHCFNQLAAVLRRHGVRPVRVLATRTRRSRLTRLMDHWVYGGIVCVDQPSGGADLRDLVRSHRVLDVQVNEETFQRIDPTSDAAKELARLDGSSWHNRASLYDKVALAARLKARGVEVAQVIDADQATPEEAITQLGLPLVVKSRTGTGGREVRIAHDVSAAYDAIDSLGGERSRIFYQRHIDGDLVGYGAVAQSGSPLQEYAALELKSVSDPLGPTARVRAVSDRHLFAAGRGVLEILGSERFVSVEFMKAHDGRLWFIDLSTRVWGNFLAWRAAGLDLTEGYLHTIGATPALPATKLPEHEELLPVFPAALSDVFRFGSWTAAARELWRDARAYAPIVGARYCALAAAGLVVDRLRLSRSAPPESVSESTAPKPTAVLPDHL